MRKAVTNAVRRRSSGYANWNRRPTGRTPTIRDTSTLFASSLPELDVFDRDMQNKAKNWHMKLNPMKGPAACRVDQVLPLGI